MLSEIDHQLLHVWGRRLRGREKGAPRIAVVGNCQSFGIAYGMKLLVPHAHVDRFTIVRKGVTTLDMLAKTLAGYDHVFSLEFQPGFVHGGGWEELKALLPDVAPIPSIVFSGFHPGTIYILDPTRSGYPIEGPTGPYHSAIALFAYLRSLPPVKLERRAHELRFPFGTPVAMAVWQWFNFTPAAELQRSPADGIARGAYLVTGLGHCGECHAPRNRWSAPGNRLEGGAMPGDGWFAPSLHPGPGASDEPAQTVALLRDGINARGVASGPMAKVVLDSTQHWLPADLHWAASYLSNLPPDPAPSKSPEADPTLRATGVRLYTDRCADCHGADGQGVRGVYPPLAGNPTVVQPSILTLIRVLDHGGFAAATAGNPKPYGMPPAMLSNEEMAAVLTYVRQSWGQRASAVSSLDVLRYR